MAGRPVSGSLEKQQKGSETQLLGSELQEPLVAENEGDRHAVRGIPVVMARGVECILLEEEVAIVKRDSQGLV